MRVTVVDDVAALAAVAPAWDELAVAAARPFAAPGWALAWWEHMRPAGAELCAVTVEDGDRLIGIAPLYAHGQRVCLLAGDFAGNVEPLAARGQEAAVAAAVAEALAGVAPRGCTVVLHQQGAEPDWPGLLAAAWPDGREPRREAVREDACPFMVIEGLDLDGWLESKSGSFRREARRRQKRFEEAEASIRLATRDTLDRDVGELLRLHRERLADRGTLLSLDGNRPMLVAAGEALIDSGRFRLLVMEVGGEAVGAQLLVAGGGEVCAWNSGFDEAHAKLSPIMQLLAHALADAIERGERRLSLGPGGQEYKQRLADGEDTLRSWTLIPYGRGYVGARLRGALRARGAAVRRRLR